MTPRFAEAIDPIFLRVFSLLERIDGGETISATAEKRDLENLIAEADKRLAGASENWELAKYALVSWIDEMLIDAHLWNGGDWWRDNVLEWSIFRSRRCNDLYYVNAKSALNANLDDAIQMIYVCVMLGFRGLYRDPRLNRMLIDKYGLATDLENWAGQYAGAVEQARRRYSDAAEAQQCEREVIPAYPLWSRSQILWPWLSVMLLAGVLFLLKFPR